MGQIGYCYGSEWHLLRFLGHHRHRLNDELAAVLRHDGVDPVGAMKWLDYPADPKRKSGDGEIVAMDFLPDMGGQAWRSFWPDKRSAPNRNGMPSWDAIGTHTVGANREWLLVEAKAHVDEFAKGGPCGAGTRSRTKILAAMHDLRRAIGAATLSDAEIEAKMVNTPWYQYANRLACLHFLNNVIGVPARLVYIGFLNDQHAGKVCPANAAQWQALVAQCHQDLGIPMGHRLSDRVHQLHLDVK